MIKHILSGIALLAFGALLSWGALELFVRFVPSSITKFQRQAIFTADPNIGYRYLPHQKATVEGTCFKNEPETINANGFRDIEWPSSATGGIAILGDSFMEGAQVPDDQILAALLRKKFDVPVINTGMTGFGTVAESRVYDTYVRPLHPSIVLLFFLTANDITDNDCRFNRAQDGSVLKACATATPQGDTVENGFFVKDGGLREWMRSSCMSCRYIAQMVTLFRLRFMHYQATSNATKNFADYQFDIYRTTSSTEMDEAWGITERSLTALRDKVEADGATFVVVSIPDFARVSRDWKSELPSIVRGAVPTDIDPWAPLHRLEDIATRDHLNFFKLEDPFLAYRDSHNLQYPYFSFACDGHWNPLGHQVAADAVAEYLVQQHFLH